MKILKTILIIFILISIPNTSFAIDGDIINTQMKELNIETFTKEASKYTNDIVDEDANKLLSMAISGEINNKSIFKNIASSFMTELLTYIKSMRNNTFNNSFA